VPLASKPSKLRAIAFGLVAVAILGAGIYVAGSVFLGARGNDAPGGFQSVRISMAGWNPVTIDAKAGQTMKLHFWDTDSAMHLSEMDPSSGGVHTFISDTLNVNVAIPAEGSKDFTFTAPTKPGNYDFWCNTCCGGKGSPDMHGKLHVEA
jgi:cytochrome c oxidase subunit 2